MKILHVEDNAQDAELMHMLVHAEWPECNFKVVWEREKFLGALAAETPDLILCDFTLGGFNGKEALALAKEKSPETPFIYLSGTIGEDRAIEALKSGATDYIIKDRPKRLVTAIKRAIRDVQEKKQRKLAEEQFLRIQRLENIGMLAAGIAHDFNNVLAPIAMAVPLLRDRATDPQDRRILDNVEKSADRGAGLIRQILGFAQGIRGAPQEVQLKHLLRDLVNVLGQTFSKSIQIEENVASNLWPVRANPTHIHQIILNLCVNARDAMPQGGALRIRASNQTIDEATAATKKNVLAGAFVKVEVEDTGTGIPPEIVERIWEPFFTTKENGRGTGLGLSTVRGIVDDHQGFIILDTKAGRGTRFEIYLPAVPAAVAPPSEAQRPKARQGSGEFILVVDDDPNVRDVTNAIFTRNGYRVQTASDGTEALAILAQKGVEVQLVVTDVNMPNLDGIALAKIVRSLSPGTRILTITGIIDEYDRSEAAKLSGAMLIKPFTAEALLNAADELLNARRAVQAAAPVGAS